MVYSFHDEEGLGQVVRDIARRLELIEAYVFPKTESELRCTECGTTAEVSLSRRLCYSCAYPSVRQSRGKVSTKVRRSEDRLRFPCHLWKHAG